MQRRVWKLIGEQPEAGDICGPSPARRFEIKEGECDSISGGRTFDEDRTGYRVDLVE
tara:strand:+ start:101 stop:271 length:171 start_codon:yes stop_codon:yes gene_type:complete